MNSTKRRSPTAKRTKLPRKHDCTRSFTDDWERLNLSGRYDMAALKEAMLLLIAGDAPLPAEYRDHKLSGKMNKYRECHIGGDFLLMYELLGNTDIIFVRAGSHADLFG